MLKNIASLKRKNIWETLWNNLVLYAHFSSDFAWSLMQYSNMRVKFNTYVEKIHGGPNAHMEMSKAAKISPILLSFHYFKAYDK